MKGDFFKGVVQWEFGWKQAIGKLPVFYQDNTSFTAIFTAPTANVLKLLPHKAMKPIEVYPGKCLAAFTAFEYRQSDIDPYNEFSISFPVSFGCMPIPGLTIGLQMLRRSYTAYVWKLPVTTEIARAGGVDLYGYPKFIADIVFKRSPDKIECELSENGKKILTLGGKVLPTSKGAHIRYRTYSMFGEIPLVANVVVNPIEYAQSMNGGAAWLDLGAEHPIAVTLKGLGLSAKPMMYQYSPLNEAILFAGRNLLDN